MTRKIKVPSGEIIEQTATGTQGFLCRTSSPEKYFFRVYNDSDFVDYELLHSDLFVTISDEDASFYEDGNGNKFLDHSPETLFLEAFESNE